MSHKFYWVREYVKFTKYIVDSYGQVGNQNHVVHSIPTYSERSDRKIGFPSEIRTIGDLKKNLVRTSECYQHLQPSQLTVYNIHEDIEFPDHMTLEEANNIPLVGYNYNAFHVKG
jgi:hypothetical protein